jgi:hypothetical protein
MHLHQQQQQQQQRSQAMKEHHRSQAPFWYQAAALGCIWSRAQLWQRLRDAWLSAWQLRAA